MKREHPASFLIRWRIGILVVLGLLLPLVAVAVDETKLQRPKEIEAQIHALERALDDQQGALDSLRELGTAMPESLRGVIEDRLRELADRLEAERERLQTEQEAMAEGAIPVPPRPPLPPGRRKKVAEGIIRFKEDVQVRRDETVNGDAIVVGGDLLVEGEVDGDAIVLAGNLQLGRRSARLWQRARDTASSRFGGARAK